MEQMPHSGTATAGNEGLLVVCLCAAWCKTCSEFRDTFDSLAKAHVGTGFVWLDVEDDSALVGDIDIENFPTLAVFRGDTPLFYGVTMPQQGVVARTLASLSRPDRDAVAVPEEIAGLPGALSARQEQR
jgi:thioredoxin reductase (NADPH)